MHSRPESGGFGGGGGGGKGSKSVSMEEVARFGLAWIDPRVNPRVKGPKKVRKGRETRVRRS